MDSSINDRLTQIENIFNTFFKANPTREVLIERAYEFYSKSKFTREKLENIEKELLQYRDINKDNNNRNRINQLLYQLNEIFDELVRQKRIEKK